MTTSGNELGRRIRAACAYSSLSTTESLANRIGLDPDTVRQIENGVVDLGDVDLAAVIEALASTTGMPAAFFTADLEQLNPGWDAPMTKIDRLETTVQVLIERIDGLADQADSQLREGASYLHEFSAIMEPLTGRLEAVERALSKSQ